MRVLDTWLEGEFIGRFTQGDDRRISFEYVGEGNSSISLSLPRAGRWVKNAPANFLDNLLPDRDDVRRPWLTRSRTCHKTSPTGKADNDASA